MWVLDKAPGRPDGGWGGQPKGKNQWGTSVPKKQIESTSNYSEQRPQVQEGENHVIFLSVDQGSSALTLLKF